MSITTTTQQAEIECTGIDLNQNHHIFNLTILARFPKHMIVQKDKRKLIFNISERSLRRQTTGRLLFIGVQRTSKEERYLT